MGNPWLGFLASEIEEFNLILYEKVHKAVLKGAYVANHYSCIYVSNQAKFNVNIVSLWSYLI